MKFLAFFLIFSNPLFAVPFQHDSGKVALSGYDTVSYFQISSSANPKKGKAKFQHKWKGVKWIFSSEKNLKKFKQKPKAYAPIFLGYCAYAAANNYIYEGDPLAWTVHEGKLYLNANAGVRASWLKHRDKYIKQANKNWPSLVP
ncbi:MAG: YHS domain-containing (seleno)protein [Oligoflexales bacterium]